jgi:PAS domain S-box-containing protein
VWNEDCEGRCTWIYDSPAGEAYGRLPGKTDLDFCERPGEAEAMMAAKRRVVETGAGARVAFVVHRGGIPYHYDTAIEPLRDAEGNILGVTCSAIDVTAQKLAEAELRQREQRFRVALANSPFVVWNQDRELRYTWLYDAGAGATLDEARGKTDYELQERRDDAEAMTAVKRQVLETGRGMRFEACTHRQSVPRYHDTVVEPLRDADGNVVGITGAATDITERKLAEQQLREANAVKDEFLGLVSHELRTPLSIIAGLSRVLARRLGDMDEQTRRETVEQLVTDSQRLQTLFEDLLILARIDRDGFEAEPLMLQHVIEAAAALHQQRYPSRKIALAIDPGLPPVDGQPAWVGQVLQNLVSNAEKYGSPETEIAITVTSEGRFAVVTVADRGPGFALADAERVFEPFWRSEQAQLRASGAGLGLAVSKRFVEVQGGRIWAEPRPGGGSVFGFTLPFSPCTAED